MRVYPSQISYIESLWLTFQNHAIEEVEPNGLGRIVMIDRKKLAIYADFYSKFFADFPLERDLK